MMSSFLGIASGLFGLVPLVAEWIGLMAMRDQRTGAWWTMMVGAAIQTLGTLGTVACIVLMFTAFGASGGGFPSSYSFLMIFASLAAAGGSLVFTAGFAMHGLKRRAAREREKQLEAMTAAMAEELRVLRERVG